MSKSLVFAYGSNLDPDQIDERCPSWKFFSRAKLPNHRMLFAGHSARWRGAVATFEHFNGAHTPGVIYRVNDLDLRILDSCEGHPHYYERQLATVITDTGARVLANVYQLVRDQDRPALPSREYALAISKGFRAWGLDQDSLARALKRTTKRAIARLI